MPATLSADNRISVKLFWVLGAITALSLWYAISAGEELLLGIPFALILGYQTLVNYRPVYFLLFASIPISTEFYFSNGLSTDLPTEPLIVGLMLVYMLHFHLQYS